MKDKLYINVHDYQGTTWALGEVGTIQDWKELALEWCDSDESWGMYDYIEKHENNEDLLKEISCHWDIEIVEFDENNAEHIELKNMRERW